MMRLAIRYGGKCYRPKNLRSFQSSSVFNFKKDDKTGEEFDEKYWESELEPEHPLSRTHRVMSKQIRQIKNRILFWREPRPVDINEWGVDSSFMNRFVDVAIIGSGPISNSIASWLKKRGGESFSIMIIEPEEKCPPISPVLSVGGLRMQYSLEENIEMSLFGAEYLREINSHLRIPNEPPIDIRYHPHGCLVLASEAGAEQLEFNSKCQNSMGAKTRILSVTQLNQRFPWLNTDNIALGCLGMENEGWFDPDCLSMAMRRKAIELGTVYETGEVKGFVFSKTPNVAISSEYKQELYRNLNHVVVKSLTGKKVVVQFAIVIIAAGYESGYISKLAKIGKSDGMLSVPLPIEPRKRFIYYADCPDGPGLNTPMTYDTSGCFFRRDGLGGNYIIGRNPQHFIEEKMSFDLDVDPNYYYDNIWPFISRRVPSLDKLKIKSSFATYYDYNTYDDTGILGFHPLYSNMMFATGFGANTIQHSPAIGRAVSELILDGEFRTIDLTRFGFDRFITEEPKVEAKIA